MVMVTHLFDSGTHFFDLESLALLLGLVGTGMSIWGLVSAVTDLSYLVDSRVNGPRRIVAVNNLTRSSFRLAVQVVVVVAGWFSVLNVRYAHEDGTLLLLCCIVVMSALVLVPDIIDRVRRVQLVRLADLRIAEDAKIGRRKTDATLAAICKELDTRE